VTGTPILAPAAGTVVFSDTLQLRGDTVIIDHGLGVFSAYNHLSTVFVNVGDEVIPGQRIALGGSTGLSTGPHLHWELRVMGVPVDGMQWTQEFFP
jgi:murein DD-endopeptidase MepM/ murein hydrolase activator NlpD